MVGTRVRRPQVAYARARGLSGRRACALLSVARSTLGYQSRLVDRDAPALAAMRRLAAQYPRYGYRRIRIFLKREGHTMSTDRTHRLWRQAGLQVPRRRPRRRVALSRPRPVPATAVNHVWAYDFVFDTCANGQTLKCLTVVDEWTRESLAIDVAGGIRSGRVIEVLTQLVSVHGAPRYLRSDNGPEFVAGAILRWLLQAQIETALIEPGKPWQNATDESFNGKFRDEYLSLQWFRNRVDAKVGIEQWRRHYNDVRPHSSLGYLTPAEFKAQLRAGSDDGGRSPDTYDFAVRHQCNILSWPLTRPLSEVALYKGHMEKALADNPGKPRPIFATMRHTVVYERKEDWEMPVKAATRQFGQFENLFKNLGDVADGFPRTIDLSELENRGEYDPHMLHRNLMFGTPDEVITKLRAYEELGVDHFTYYASLGLGMKEQKRSMELFVQEVMPAFA